MASLISNPQVTNSNSDRVRKKKKKKSPALQHKEQENQIHTFTRWRSEKQQKVYSSKLLQALNKVRLSPAASPSAPRRGRVVRETADRVLAVAARGRTRWSRAILTNRLKLKFRKQKKQKTVASPINRSKKPRIGILRLKGKGINLPAMQRKVRVLGGLVPGCRKEPLPVILEEATDYIAALEMQVRAMSALANLLSGSTLGHNSAPPPS